jgi:hypothetical protein
MSMYESWNDVSPPGTATPAPLSRDYVVVVAGHHPWVAERSRWVAIGHDRCVTYITLTLVPRP